MTRTATIVFGLGVLGLSQLGCTSDDAGGTGAVEFTTWGEDYIEQEIPADKVEDGWRVTFSKMLVSLGRITIADQAGEIAAQTNEMVLVNHVLPGVKEVAHFHDLEAKAWDRVSYEISPTPTDVVADPGVSAEDKQFMIDNGYADYIEATLEKGTETRTIRWGFTLNTRYEICAGPKDGKETEGVIVTNGGSDQVELTIHGDHYFYDDLQAANALVRADVVAAADADMDGEVTQAELDAVQLIDLPEDQYGTGAAGDINTLKQYIDALSRTIGHFRGEGECFASPR